MVVRIDRVVSAQQGRAIAAHFSEVTSDAEPTAAYIHIVGAFGEQIIDGSIGTGQLRYLLEQKLQPGERIKEVTIKLLW